ncbi:peptidoglycan-binding domain-containing protein [Corallococcus exiguus]|uniref:peptidoglycan-binding domain-containing protein n=1 Tax=Corallococcus exiguus TaxID=83462 RepID=UPI001493F45B|nr:peptidoglycan-binding domain-containing protein [Corallococcus exiguus]NPD28814.1 peptidoglycan-binding protein [Corallococcus exiguus]
MRLKPESQAPQRVAAHSQHSHHLGVGSSGPDVNRLEKKLIQQCLLKGRADDHFDSRTQAAVKQFERIHGFKHVDGVVGNAVQEDVRLRRVRLREVWRQAAGLGVREGGPPGVRAILEHLGLPTACARLASARGPPQAVWC